MNGRIFVLIGLLASIALAQNSKAPAKAAALPAPAAETQPTASNPPDMPEYLAANFGGGFSLVPKFPVMVADLDGDGVEDAIFVVTGKDNPLLDEVQFHYKVIDPYDEYFGWGDPKVTMQFNAKDPALVKFIAIVHSWRTATPKAKFVVINLPFEKIYMTRIPVKKKTVVAIGAEELGGIKSAIFWDGKKYRWDAVEAPLE